MINFTNTRPTILDNESRPLYGKICFFDAKTTNPKAVYDADGNSLGDVLETNQHGRITSAGEDIQVFLDGSYDVAIYKFVGTQFDLDDETQWEEVRTDRIIDPTKVTFDISGSGIVNTIQELRDLPAGSEEDSTSIIVMGYHSAGDMTPQYYIWDEDSVDEDYGGNVICPEGRTEPGRWIMVPQERIDVRAFGAQPSSTQANASNEGITPANGYANTVGRALWFPKSGTKVNYGFIGGVETSSVPWIIDREVVLLAKNDTSLSVKEFQGDGFSFAEMSGSNWTVTSDMIKSSWMGTIVATRFTTSMELVVDRSRDVQASGIKVHFTVPYANAEARLTNCEIVCEGEISSSATLVLSGCRFTDRYFSGSGDIDLSSVTLTNCIADIDDFKRVNNWFNSCRKMGQTSFDFQGKGFESDVTLNFAANIRNGEFNHKVTCTANATFRDCQFADLFCNRGYTLVFESCTLSISDNVYTQNLVMRNCVVNNSNYGVLGRTSTNLNGCKIGCKIGWMNGQNPYGADAIVAHDTQFTEEVRVAYCEFYSCDFDDDLYVYSTRLDGTECTSCRIIGCIFRESAYQHYYNGEDTPCTCVWKNNQFFCNYSQDAISFSYPPKSDECYYEYEGNTGNCRKSKDALILNKTPTYEKFRGRFLASLANGSFYSFALGNVKVKVTIKIPVTFWWSYTEGPVIINVYFKTLVEVTDVKSLTSASGTLSVPYGFTKAFITDDSGTAPSSEHQQIEFGDVLLEYEVVK